MSFDSFAEYYQAEMGHFEQEHRSGGTFGLTMMEVQQSAAEFTDPAIPQICFVQMLVSPQNYRLDFGDGVRWHTPATTDLIGPQPSGAECHFQMDGPHTIRVLALDNTVLYGLLDAAGFRHDPIDELYAEMAGSEAARSAFLSLWLAMNSDAQAASLAVDGAFMSFLAHYLPDAGTTLSPAWEAGVEDKRIARVLDYIEAHLAEQLLMSELAAVAHLSVSHFARSFRATTGKTAHAYVTERRIARAKSLLRQSNLSITAIALDCGFGSSAHFATVFKKSVGAAPSDFRFSFH